MSLEAILTFITVVLAVIALIPAERGEDLRIRLGGSISIVTAIATVLILYWSLLEPLHSLPWLRRLPRPIGWLDGWDPASSSLLVLLVATGLAWWNYGRQVPPTRIPRLGVVLASALARRRYGECVHLLEAHFASLASALSGDYWQARLRSHFFPTPAERHRSAISARACAGAIPADPAESASQAGTPAPDTTEPDPRSIREIVLSFPASPPRGPLSRRFVSWAEEPREAAQDTVRSISLAPGFVAHVAEVNPYLGLHLLQLPSSWLANEFAETYARSLLSDPESVFCRELRRAQNVDAHNVPIVDSADQPLLSALCEDSVRRDGPRLLYTFLDVGITGLRLRQPAQLIALLNGPIGDYPEEACWVSPPFATIYLLRIVAPRNAVAPNAQLLSLYGLRTQVDALLDNLAPTPDVDPTREWPTPSHYLIYASVSLLVDIVKIWRDRPHDLPADKLVESVDGLPAILSVHAIDVLSSVMFAVLRTSKLDTRFKAYLLGVWWNAYWEKYKAAWAQSALVLESLVRGGGFGPRDMEHRDGLAEALSRVDHMTQLTGGGDQLRAAFDLPPR